MLTVFTPSHDPRFLDECWASLKAQTHEDFEWVVVLNNGARWLWPDDPRIVVKMVDELRGVGAAKSYACSVAAGDILVELDHDDLLTDSALEQIAKRFDSDPNIGFVYSDGAQILERGEPDPSTWDQNNGWIYNYVDVLVGTPTGSVWKKVLGVQAMEPTPHNVSLIWFAPNHVRAFRKDVYEAVGGYDASLDILDDQDLMCRLYQATEFSRIPTCLYLQRIHDNMTQVQLENNGRIQTTTVNMYDGYVERNAMAWAKRRNLPCLDLGGAFGKPDGYFSIDRNPPADYMGDVFEVLASFPESSVGVIRAVDFLEHIEDSVALMNAIYRVLAPDGMLISSTPSTDGRGAFQDPTHCSYWNENRIWYFTDSAYAQYVIEIKSKFQTSRAVTYFPSDFHRAHNISYIQANLIALKPGGSRNGGYLRW